MTLFRSLDEKGVKIIAYGVVNAEGDDDWRQLFEFGKAMGIETFTSEPKAKDIPLLSKLSEEYKINVAIHNHPSPRNYWHPDSVLAAIKGQGDRIRSEEHTSELQSL